MGVFKRYCIFLFLFIGWHNMAAGQEKELTKMTFPDFVRKYQNNTIVDTIKDIELYANYKDTSYWQKSADGDYHPKQPKAFFKNTVIFMNCSIHGNFKTQLAFCDTLSERDSLVRFSMLFDHCELWATFYGSFAWIGFDNCKIHNLNIAKSHINKITFMENHFLDNEGLNFYKCTFDCFPVTNLQHISQINSVDFIRNENLSVTFTDCKFEPNKKNVLTCFGGDGNIDEFGGGGISYKNFIIRNSKFFEPVSFDNIKIERAFILDSVKFDSTVSFTGFESPVNSTFIDWKLLQNKLFLTDGVVRTRTGKGNYSLSLNEPYYAKQDSDLLKYKSFKKLMASYNFFTSLYTNNGDEEARNAVYLEKKELSTARSRALSHEFHSVYYFITYQLNRFLSWFCDYATNPVRAIINCLKMMLFFALVFFIFPSQPDHLEKYRFMKYFKRAIEYFSTDKSLADLHKEAHHEHLMELEHFKLEMKKSKKLVPKIVTSLGQLFYLAHHSAFTLFNKTLLSIDVSKKSWIHVSKGKKVVLGIFTGIYFIGYVINGIITRAINAIMLSLNSFVTLGAAGIETRGIAKVFTVIEGSIGWFFLAILTVTLITQLLQ